MADINLTEAVQSKLNSIASYYSREIYENTYKVLMKYNVTGRLIDSVKVKWIKATSQYPPRILVIFEDYAKIFEIRQPLWNRMPPIDEMISFVKARNLVSSGKIPGYKNGAPNLSDRKKDARIAYAVALSKRNNDRWRRKPWRKKSLSAALKAMNQITMETFRNEIENIMADAISYKHN